MQDSAQLRQLAGDLKADREDLDRILGEAAQSIPPRGASGIGSRVRGDAEEFSDLDISSRFPGEVARDVHQGPGQSATSGSIILNMNGHPPKLDSPVELAVIAPKQRVALCRVLRTRQEISLHSRDVRDLVPGEIVVVRFREQWRRGHSSHVSGDVESHYLDVAALDLTPLRLQDEWVWHPEEHYWGEDGEPLEEWAKPIVMHGARPSYAMERVWPGEDWGGDRILEAAELNEAGEPSAARKILMGTLVADLRCLDAHAHLGNFVFERDPETAIRHYEVGVRIGELSLGDDFDGALEWGRTDNRPVLRCMHGFGLCLWRLGHPDEAAAVFERMLWLNPADNQGIRFLLPRARAGGRWEDVKDF